MRVLHVIPWLATRMGGPVVSVVESSLALRRWGFESAVFTTDMGVLPSSGRRERAGVESRPTGAEQLDVRAFPARWPYRVAFSPGLWRALEREVADFDVVHIHSLFQWPQFAAFRQATRHGVPYVVAPCGALDPHLRRRSRAAKAVTDALWQRRMLSRAAALHYKTEEEARLVEDLGFAAPARVVPNGIDWVHFQELPDPGGFRERYLDGHEGPVITTVGRLSHKKGLDILIRAFALVARERADCRLVIAGPDDEHLERPLTRLAGEEGVAGRVTFTGMITGEDKLAALAASAVWALPSHTENFGVAVVEALAAGLPVVTSPAVNLAPDIARAGAGIICEAEPVAFARQLARVLDEPELAARLGATGREFARRYDWAAVAPRLAEMYREAAAGAGPAEPRRREAAPAPAAGDLAGLLRCPLCREAGVLEGSLDEGGALTCAACGRAYPVVDGIPILLPFAGGGDGADGSTADAKRSQMAFFDEESSGEFETLRPHGTPRYYGWLLEEKFRRSLIGLEGEVAGRTALTVCGGSGMDGEFLARAGAGVIVSDISLGAARRARERAARFGLELLAIVADAEALPFTDRAVDLVYVHDGLHHLERPQLGLAEMARVAARAVSVTEPARAAATALAVRLHLALEREDAGNRVARLKGEEVAAELRSRGFTAVEFDRYAMYYRHEPGAVMRRLSSRRAMPVAKAAFLAANRLGGRFGNKLAVRARRAASPPADLSSEASGEPLEARLPVRPAR